MTDYPRRRFLAVMGATAVGAAANPAGLLLTGETPASAIHIPDPPPEFRIRTITAGVPMRSAADQEAVLEALDFLSAARERFAAEYEVQTQRIATDPVAEYIAEWKTDDAVAAIAELDRMAADTGTMFSIGPVLTSDEGADGFGRWAADLIGATSNTSLSCFIASEESGRHERAIRAAAEAISSIAGASPGGEGNFRFCATAFCPPGTPFFPAAWHAGGPAFSIGLESPNLLMAALQEAIGGDPESRDPGGGGPADRAEIERAMIARLNAALAPIDAVAQDIAARTGRRYLGIDTSPAPGLDASIGAVIETLAGGPFGSVATLSACSSITNVLQGLDTRTFGYSGLMLPVLEDRVLADRATEGLYDLQDLLLYSSVCGTGLDVVPLPGDAPIDALEAVIGDVAALALRYRKPLSARLFPIPGKAAGDMVDFENPFLTRCRVMELA